MLDFVCHMCSLCALTSASYFGSDTDETLLYLLSGFPSVCQASVYRFYQRAVASHLCLAHSVPDINICLPVLHICISATNHVDGDFVHEAFAVNVILLEMIRVS